VSLRAADEADADFLLELWRDSLRRADDTDRLADLLQIIKDAAASPEQRLVLAEYDGERAGAVLLRIDTTSPLDLDPAVHVLAIKVSQSFRRRGVGRQLMESGVAFGEENGVVQVMTSVDQGARDANRFLARLALTPHAGYRSGPITAVRARMAAQRPSMADPAVGRQRSRTLAARRSLRRRRAATTPPVAPPVTD
jgi:ribosomal protein S18 acetylase RimI-like enzyme